MAEKKLWEKAEERVSFRRHLYAFLIVNAVFWLIWFVSNSRPQTSAWSFPWPIYPLIGWGIALAYHYYSVFSGDREKSVRKEYDKLRGTQSLSEKEYRNMHLFNAAVVGENPDTSFFIEGGKLHAIDPRVASLKREKSDPDHLLPPLRDALKALIQFSENKVPSHFSRIDWPSISNDQDLLVMKITQIYSHLPHHERNLLSSLIHHSQITR